MTDDRPPTWHRYGRWLALGNVVWPLACVVWIPLLGPRTEPDAVPSSTPTPPKPVVTSGHDLPPPPAEWHEPLTPAGGPADATWWSPSPSTDPATAAPSPSPQPATPSVSPTSTPDPDPTVIETETPEPEPTPSDVGTDAKINGEGQGSG